MIHHPPNLDEILDSADSSRKAGQTLAELIVSIDGQLAKIDHALNKLQPSKTGKLRITWWKRRGKLVPTVVKWIYVKPMQKWRAERVNLESFVLSVRTSVEFKADAPAVKELMRRTKVLLQLRVRALEVLQTFQHVAELLHASNEDKLAKFNADLNGLLEVLENRTDNPASESGPSSPVLLEMEPEDE
ncbi:hypothetical protein [Noviherbaspirillum pedocola]|uniref:Uncharacterized protein n=1 Tax=Noviherbaspirillum pedocola TaxID=2801341 RepID=A0A934SZM6_9BURK|nr:hypothetical protein [Noviherbaspirillum pedocola]MBK4737946.1 hypothetical protein [Noviherbaspirillum pedocola]